MTTTTTTATRPLTVQLAVRATRQQVWDALVDGEITPAYYYGFRAEYDLSPGAAYRYVAGGGDVIAGTVTALEPGQFLTTTFAGFWDPDVAALPESTVTFRLSEPPMPMPGVTMLSCVHEGLPDGATAASLEQGWVSILSGLKTLLETGSPLVPPPAG